MAGPENARTEKWRTSIFHNTQCKTLKRYHASLRRWKQVSHANVHTFLSHYRTLLRTAWLTRLTPRKSDVSRTMYVSNRALSTIMELIRTWKSLGHSDRCSRWPFHTTVYCRMTATGLRYSVPSAATASANFCTVSNSMTIWVCAAPWGHSSFCASYADTVAQMADGCPIHRSPIDGGLRVFC